MVAATRGIGMCWLRKDICRGASTRGTGISWLMNDICRGSGAGRGVSWFVNDGGIHLSSRGVWLLCSDDGDRGTFLCCISITLGNGIRDSVGDVYCFRRLFGHGDGDCLGGHGRGSMCTIQRVIKWCGDSYGLHGPVYIRDSDPLSFGGGICGHLRAGCASCRRRLLLRCYIMVIGGSNEAREAARDGKSECERLHLDEETVVALSRK